MRLLTLSLERYGPFTGRTLTFAPDAKLHVVYGPNEAGKSCSLAAVTDLLFGIERQTCYDFLHAGNDMRIGATITARDGRSLTFRRRKGNKNTIINAADLALSDDSLLPYVGTLSRDVFCHAFGLNTVALREGAEEMLKSEGDVGASLFAAASGLRGLTELRRGFDSEADGIFAMRASKERRFYQVLERYEEARNGIRAHELKAGDWKTLNDDIDENAGRLSEIKTERGKKASESARLSRLKRVAPLVRLMDEDAARLTTLGILPDVPTGFAERLRVGLAAHAAADDEKKRALADETKAVRLHAGITFDDALIKDAEEVLTLFSEIGAYASNQRDLPRIQAETDEYRGSLVKIAIGLGFADASSVENKQPTDAAQALVRSLITEGRKLKGDVTRHRNTLAGEQDALAEVERQRGDRGQVSDPLALQEQFLALAPVLKQLDRRLEIERTILHDTRELKEAAARLDPSVLDLDELAKASLPGTETIARFRKDIDALSEKIGREQDRVTTAVESASAIELTLRNLSSGRPVPTTEAILAKRQQRDEEWKLLRATLFGAADSLSGPALAETVGNFERHNTEADQLADDATKDANRVASHDSQTHRLAEEQGKKEKASEVLQALEARLHEVTNQWDAAWAPALVKPQTPAQMIAWVSFVGGLLGRRDKLQVLRDDLAKIDALLRGIDPALAAIAAESGLQQIEGLETGLLSKRIEEQLGTMKSNWDKARDLETSVRDTQSRIKKHASAEAVAAAAHDEWTARWQLAIPGIGLTPIATLDEAEAALACWKDVPETIRQRDSRARRVTGMQRDIDKFAENATRIILKIAPDLAGMPPDLAIKTISARLAEARRQEARSNESATHLEEATHERIDAETSLREAEEALAILASELPPQTDLNEFLARAAEREKVLEALEGRRTQLISQAEGHSEESLRADLAAFDTDQAEAMLKTLAGEEELLNTESQEAYAAHDRAVRRRAELEKGVGAEAFLQQRRSAEVELAVAAREWAILKLGALLIGGVVDRHRTGQQNPMIERAGVLFSTLTGGAYTRLGHDYDEADVPHLVAHGNSGRVISVTGMSDGTRDQLYLALRLAYLEDYAAHAEPTPFICDDVFTTFDDGRTANALATLSAIGTKVQPIVFTHHKHVVDIATAQLGSDVNVIDLG